MISSEHLSTWNNLRFGLVLSGGGAKGAYEMGVIKALHKLDFLDKVVAVSGTSIGAINTIVMSSGDIDEMEKLWMNIDFRHVFGTPEMVGKENLAETLKFIKENHKNMSFSNIKEEIKDDLSNVSIKPATQELVREIIDYNLDYEKMVASSCQYYVCAYNRKYLTPVFFNLNKLNRETAIKAVLASSSIPHVYPSVIISGDEYSDGGINDAELNCDNACNTPIEPLKDMNLDAVIVVYLSDKPELVSKERYSGKVINIVPSESLEIIKYAGTMNFSQSAIRNKMQLGYRDAMAALSPILLDVLKGDNIAPGELITD